MLRPVARQKSPRMEPRKDEDTSRNVEGLTRSRLKWVCSAKHNTTSLDCIETFPNHGNDRAHGHVLDQTREEGLALEIGIVYRVSN